MNLLTDIIRDVASDMKINLTEEESISIQKSALSSIVSNLAWIKHERIMDEGMPWLAKTKKEAA